jgi:hypothetical protein
LGVAVEQTPELSAYRAGDSLVEQEPDCVPGQQQFVGLPPALHRRQANLPHDVRCGARDFERARGQQTETIYQRTMREWMQHAAAFFNAIDVPARTVEQI